jgi:GTP-binding protein
MLTSEFCTQLMERRVPLRMQFVQSGAELSHLPPSSTFEVAIVGRSNVGKSSLLNFIAGERQLARVSSTPGRTQLINYFEVEKGAFHIVDLPGYGFAVSPREVQAHWARQMQVYFEGRTSLVGVLFLVDARRDMEEADVSLVQWLLSMGLHVLAVQTKCDKLNKSQIPIARMKQSRTLGLAPGNIISTSVEKKQGMPELFAGLAGLLTQVLQDQESKGTSEESKMTSAPEPKKK